MIDNPGTMKSAGYPDIYFIVDSSGSMGWAPFEEQENYHIVCVGVYAILHFLRETGILEDVSFNIINFSDITISSGWVDHFEMDKFKKILFHYQGGGTSLNKRVLEDTAKQHLSKVKNYDSHFLMFLISDGYIANEDEVVKVIEQLLSKQNQVVYMSIGVGETPFFKKLEKFGALGLVIKNTQKLDYLMPDITKKQFESNF